MRVLLAAVIVAWIMPVRATSGPAKAPGRARAVIEKAIEAMGGDAALAKVKGMRIQGRGTYKMGPMESPYTSEAIYVAPDRVLWKVDSPGFQGSAGLDGETGWWQMMAPAARAAGGARKALMEWPNHFEIWLLRPLLHHKGIRLRGGQTREEDGKTISRVRVRFPEGTRFTLTFAQAEKVTLIAFEGDMTQMDGRRGRFVTKFSKPKRFGDITLPSFAETQVFVGDKAIESMREETTAIEWNPKIAGDAFAMPKLDIKLWEASVKEVPSVQGLALLHRGPYDHMGETIEKLMEISQEAGLIPAGAVIAIYLNDPNQVADVADLRTEIVVPVMVFGDPPATFPGGAAMKEVPAATVAAMAGRGPYGKADVEALKKLMGWIQANGYDLSGPPRMLYHHRPGLAVPEDQVSEVQLPVRKRP